MKYYDEIAYVKSTYKYLDHTDDYVQIDLAQLCDESNDSDMQPLTPAVISGHALGVVAVGILPIRGSLELCEPLAYAGVTGFTEINGDKLAVIGGVVTVRSAQGAGIATSTVSELVAQADAAKFGERHGHAGYAARCNDLSAGIFKRLGFINHGIHDGKWLMTKTN